VDVRHLDVRHQAVSHQRCFDRWSHGDPLTRRQSPGQRDAGDENMLVNIVSGDGLDKGCEPFAGLTVRRRETYMANLHTQLDARTEKTGRSLINRNAQDPIAPCATTDSWARRGGKRRY